MEQDGNVIGVVFAKRTEAFTYAVVSRGFDKLVREIIEKDNTGVQQASLTLNMGTEYRPPEDLQSDIIKMQLESAKKPPAGEGK